MRPISWLLTQWCVAMAVTSLCLVIVFSRWRHLSIVNENTACCIWWSKLHTTGDLLTGKQRWLLPRLSYIYGCNVRRKLTRQQCRVIDSRDGQATDGSLPVWASAVRVQPGKWAHCVQNYSVRFEPGPIDAISSLRLVMQLSWSLNYTKNENAVAETKNAGQLRQTKLRPICGKCRRNCEIHNENSWLGFSYWLSQENNTTFVSGVFLMTLKAMHPYANSLFERRLHALGVDFPPDLVGYHSPVSWPHILFVSFPFSPFSLRSPHLPQISS